MVLPSIQTRSTPLLLTLCCMVLSTCTGDSTFRDVNKLAQWANQKGVVMHDSLQWKKQITDSEDETENDDNIGLELKELVEPGTVLLKVPRSIVFDALCIRKELEDESPEKVQKALKALEQSGLNQHKDGFFIFVKVLKCCQRGDSSLWSPYIQSLPQNFVEFSPTEKSCLPYYAKYVADYQEEKFDAFCKAAVESGLVESVESDSDDDDFNQARWAFCAISSRFWKTSSTEEETAAIMKGETGGGDNVDDATSELVPVGDMFNHREPPNVAITHEGDYVNFVYKGNTEKDAETKELYITYGQPSNPHRFLGIFGFVPIDDMPNVWSHVVYNNNPFTNDVENMVFRAQDGHVPKKVWDAVLYALLEPRHPTNEPPEFTEEQHKKYRSYTADILQTHIANQLQELAVLREKIKTIEAIGMTTSNTKNIPLVRQHNEFLTDVFTKAHQHVSNELKE
mmetsp:Transcript_8003/g.18600  ORF Transcript_8003/g.18600 Transcript_8003/m.18600 type:complete len:454 (+) Transcript_8003:35-1396(+)